MIEESVHPVRLQLVQHKMESRLHASGDGCARLIAAVIADAERRQTESRCRNARHPSCVVSCGERAVLHLSGRRVCLLPEKKENSFLDFLEQLVVRSGVAVSRRRWWRRGVSAAATKREKRHARQRRNRCHLAEMCKNFTPREIVLQRVASSLQMEKSYCSYLDASQRLEFYARGRHALRTGLWQEETLRHRNRRIDCLRNQNLQANWWAR